MSKFVYAAMLSVLAATPAFAQNPPVPEIDAGAGIAAIALLAGAAAIIREKINRK